MSPGTISRILISVGFPSRFTVAVARTSSLSFSASLWDLYSWKNDRKTLRKIMRSTSRAWIFSPKQREKVAMIRRMMTRGSVNF